MGTLVTTFANINGILWVTAATNLRWNSADMEKTDLGMGQELPSSNLT